MRAVSDTFVLVARVLIFAWFVPEGIGKIAAYSGTASFMASHGVPGLLLPLVILTEIGCGTLILVGWNTRVVAFLLAGYTFLAVLLFHLHPANAGEKIVQMAELVDAGGFLVLAAHGAGRWSLDAVLDRGRTRERATDRPLASPQA